jgi:hypothetical protein
MAVFLERMTKKDGIDYKRKLEQHCALADADSGTVSVVFIPE